MLNITNQRNANQNYKIPPHTSKMATIRKEKRVSFGKDVEKVEPFCFIGGNVIWYNYCEKLYIPQKIKTRITCDPAIPLWGISLK